MKTWLLFHFVALAVLGGCSSPSSSAPSSGSTLIYSRGEDANTLDPIHTDIGETVKVLVNVYDTLVTYDDVKAELVPSLAESWSVSDDGKQWTFQLRQDVLFHDGTPFHAEAVVFSMERLIQQSHAHVYDSAVPYRPSFQFVEKVSAKSEHEVVFDLKAPSAIFLQNLAMFPASVVSPTAVKQWKKEYGEHPAGTGPFKLLAWKRDQQLVLEAFEKHWRGPPGVPRIIFLPIHDQATRVQQIKRGEVHIADEIPADEIETLATLPGIVVQEQKQSMNTVYLSMQTQKPPLNHVDVRRAIAQAIDKKRFVELQYRGHALPAKSIVPPSMWAHYAEGVDYAFDPAAAKQLLESAAKQGNFPLPLELSLHVMAQSRPYLPEPSMAAAFIKDSLAAIGIKVTIHQQDVNQHFPYLMAGKHELGLSGWTSDNNDPDNFLYSLLDSDNISEHGNNLSKYDQPRVHELLKSAQTEMDRERRLAMYLEAQQQIQSDVPLIPLAHAFVRVTQREQVRGFMPHPTGLVRLRTVRLEAQP
jgi:peptide/nickel transport system substrate-binding protein